MATARVGENRTGAVYRIVGGIVYFLFVGWITSTLAAVIAGLYAAGDLVMKLVLNRRLKFGRAWANSTLRWNYDIVLWVAGLEAYPGTFGWMP